jgi:hypothetical protein
MIKNLDKIQELLKTKKQGTYDLYNADHCVCIEGVFALAWGATVGELNEYNDTFYNLLYKDRILTKVLHHNCYKNTGLNQYVKNEIILQINLTDEQRKIISKQSDKEISWVGLNDMVGLTFEQFSELLNIIENQTTANNLP